MDTGVIKTSALCLPSSVWSRHSTINDSVSAREQVAGSTDSRCTLVWDEPDYILHHFPPRELKCFRNLETATVIERQGGLRRVNLHRAPFMLLFIMVPTNPCLVRCTRATICQHPAGGLQGSKQLIGCTELTM